MTNQYENGEWEELRLEDQTKKRNIFNYCFSAFFIMGAIIALVLANYPSVILIASVLIIIALSCIWYGIVDSKKRFFIISNKKISFLTPRFFGGMKSTEIRWFKLKKIVFKIEYTIISHESNEMDYYFTFEYENGLVKEVQKGVSVSSFSYKGMLKIADALKQAAEKRGIKYRAYDIRRKEFGGIIKKTPI